MRISLPLVLVFVGCSPTVTGKALVMSGGSKRVAVAAAVKDAYTSGIENAILALGQGRLTLLSRSEQAAMGKEKELQYSGDFSDEGVVSMGRQMGAELLFVVRDEVRETKIPAHANTENCSFRYGDGTNDDEAKRAANAQRRAECEQKNEAERKRAAAEPPRIVHNYRTNVRVIDVTTGEMLAFGDADVGDGQAGLTCSYPCTRDAAGDLAVRAILGITEKK